MRSREYYVSKYPAEHVCNTKNIGKRVWYLMRIVGNNSDILVQNTLDALLMGTGQETSAQERAKTLGKSMQERVDIAIKDLDPSQLENYVYPKVIIENINKSRRKDRICPLLTGYMFCKADERLLVNIVNRIPNFIFCYPRPLNDIKRVVISDTEMDNFINALKSASLDYDARIITYEEARTHLKKDTRVRIEGGLLHDVVGIIGTNKDRKHLFITIGGTYTLAIKLKKSDKTVPIGGLLLDEKAPVR